MRHIRTVLVALRTLRPRNPLLEKAAHIAAGSGARLELFHDLSTPVFIDTAPRTGKALAAITEAARTAALARLEKLAAPLRARGLKVAVEALWDFPPYEAIVRRARAIHADLIVVAKAGHHRLPALMGYTDWELLRASPLPVLLVKGRRAPARATVLAAVDPAHSSAKPAALDARILAGANALGAALSLPVHALHVQAPWAPGGLGDLSQGFEALASERAARKSLRAAMTRLGAGAGLGSSRLHVLAGRPELELPRAARRLRAGVVVMGDMSRRGLKRLFLGNTAERLLDDLHCDVLIIKPAHFVAPLPSRRRGIYYLSSTPMPLG